MLASCKVSYSKYIVGHRGALLLDQRADEGCMISVGQQPNPILLSTNHGDYPRSLNVTLDRKFDCGRRLRERTV